MKNIIVVFVFALSMLALVGCEEIVIEKIVTDTVYVDKPGPSTLVPTYITVRDTVTIRDTVEVKVVIRDTVINEIHTTDTLIQVVTKDSIIIKEVEKVVYHTDTVIQVVRDTVINDIHHYDTITKTVIVHDTVEVIRYDRTVIYLDTAYVVSYMRPVWSVPDELMPHVQAFYDYANQYSKETTGGIMIIQYVTDLPGEGWSSNSYQISDNSQMIIELDQRYPHELQRAGIFREMARLQMGKKYTTTADRIMNPLFSPETVISKNHLDDLFK